MDIDNQESHDDPQFVKVLETCLKMEIAAAKEKLDANTKEISKQNRTMRSELDKRKQLKEKVAQMNRIRTILSETLTKLRVSISEISDTLEVMRANADDQYKLIQLRSQEYQDIIAKYKETWHAYRARYEEFPLAKARNAAKINLEKLKIEHMVITYKKAEMITIIKQRWRIDWIRTRCKIIEFATVMMERLKLQERLTRLKANADHRRRELGSIEVELQALRKRVEDQKRLRKQKMLEMAPPKINIPYREMYAQHQMRARVQHQWRRQVRESFDDTVSVNTLVLEELCINDNTAVSPEEISIDMISSDDYTRTAIQTEKSNFKSIVVSKETDTRAVSVEPDAEVNAEKAALTDNDVEMKESHHQEETQESQEPVKTQPSSCTKENPLKHSAAKNTQDEIEPKRIRLQREDSKGNSNEITAPQPSAIVKEVNLTSAPPSIPKITNIESVHYNVTPLMPTTAKLTERSSIAASSMFSPTHYEYCDSNMSFFDQDFASKGAPSLYGGSLCNYKLSPISNISPTYVEENAQIVSPPMVSSPHNLQQDKDQSDNRTLSFQFNNFMKKARSDFTTLF